MAHPATSSSVQAYALCIVVLYVKFFISARLQGSAKYVAGSRPPEDSGFGPALGRPRREQNYGVHYDPKDPKQVRARQREQRWDRIIMNDLENLPFSLFIFGAAILVECNETRLVASMGVFTVARCVFTYCFAKSLQPHRTLFYAVAAIAVAVTVGDILLQIYRLRV